MEVWDLTWCGPHKVLRSRVLEVRSRVLENLVRMGIDWSAWSSLCHTCFLFILYIELRVEHNADHADHAAHPN